MRSSPLQLESLFFPLVSVRALVPKDVENAPANFESDDLKLEFDFDFDDDGENASAGLRLSSIEANKASPKNLYSFEIEVFARFQIVGPEHKDARAIYLRKFAAASALIGAAREQVALMTSRGPWGCSYLPLITIDQVIGRPPEGSPKITEGQTKSARSRKKEIPKS